MDGNKSERYIEKIVLEIIDRSRFWFQHGRGGKFNIARFNAREAAYALLKKYDGQPLMKAQKIDVRYNNQDLYLCVRDLIYGKISQVSNTNVEFIYQKTMFSEMKWPVVTVNRTSRVRWANDHNQLVTTPGEIPEVLVGADYSSINVDEPASISTGVVPCVSCNDQSLSVNLFCRECRVRRSVSDLQKLINDGSVTLKAGMEDENHFRSSIFIHLNQNKN